MNYFDFVLKINDWANTEILRERASWKEEQLTGHFNSMHSIRVTSLKKLKLFIKDEIEDLK